MRLLPTFAILTLALALVGASGCIECEPLLEVRHCLETQCEPSADAVAVAWTQSDAAMWPDLDRILRSLEAGAHEHLKWTPEQEAALWDHYGVAGDEKELIVTLDDERYRVRVLSCA